METYNEPKQLVPYEGFSKAKHNALKLFDNSMLDKPLVPVIEIINSLPYVYTLQCCWGHFIYEGLSNRENVLPLPPLVKGQVEYKLAYIAFCVENSFAGRKFIEISQQLTQKNSDYLQFLSADWFWDRNVNSYAVQVMPIEYKMYDTAIFSFDKALTVEQVRNKFYSDFLKSLKELSKVS